MCNERLDIDNSCTQQLNGAWVSMETHVVSMRIRVVSARVCVRVQSKCSYAGNPMVFMLTSARVKMMHTCMPRQRWYS